ncbi:MAG TPA: tetratricopeptide repeat protein [Streptosporangiaceae bacterium]
MAWPVRSGAVPPLADGFSGRPETEPGVRAALVPGAVVVLVPQRASAEGAGDWLGPCGKTQLAVFLAESLWRSRKLDLLVWITATSHAAVLAGFAEAAVTAMGIDEAGDAEPIASRFVGWLGETSRPWMVVLDDLSDEADLHGLWPEGPAGRVLVTSRNPGVLPTDRALVLPVGVFSPREALSYLMGRLTVDPDQRIGAIDLVDDLGCEPLALAQASAVIAGSALSCREYRDYFARRRDRLAETTYSKLSAAQVTWILSVEQAERLSPDGAAKLLLALGSLLDGHGIPGALFTAAAACGYLTGASAGRAADPKGAWSAMLLLEQSGLLAIDTSPARTVRISSAVQATVRAALPIATLHAAARAAADALLEIWPGEEPPPTVAAGLRACAASLQLTAGDLLWEGGCHPLLLRGGRSLDSAYLAGPAVTYWQDLAMVSDRLLGPGHPDTITIRDQLARSYLAAGQAANAVSLFQWVLTGLSRARHPDQPVIVLAQINLGRALVAAGQTDDAVTVLGQATAACERLYGPDRLETLGARDELATACRAAGKTEDAIRLYRRTLADRERIEGARHPDTVVTRQRLADTYLAEGRIKEAVAQYKRALGDLERVLGAEHMDTITARGNLAAAYHAAGRMAAALQLYEQTCADCERALGPDHPDTLARRTELAHTYYAVGRLTDARSLLTDTVARCERVLAPGDPLTQKAQEILANIAGG